MVIMCADKGYCFRLPPSGNGVCSALLKSETVVMLGSTPSCLWESSDSLLVNFGSGPTFSLNDQLLFLDGVIQDITEM